jgi:hypothetical protein
MIYIQKNPRWRRSFTQMFARFYQLNSLIFLTAKRQFLHHFPEFTHWTWTCLRSNGNLTKQKNVYDDTGINFICQIGTHSKAPHPTGSLHWLQLGFIAENQLMAGEKERKTNWKRESRIQPPDDSLMEHVDFMNGYTL